jgi:serine/threonine protein kinase
METLNMETLNMETLNMETNTETFNLQDINVAELTYGNVEGDIKILKQIGKGSFSNVFLCSEKKFKESKYVSEYFIIKKININDLIKKYKQKNKKNNTIEKTEIQIDKEREYYYNKLEEMIESEIEILSELHHLNIIEFYGYTKKRGIYYLRMEYCNGGDVYEYLKNKKNVERNCFGGFSNNFMQEFIRQTSNGLKYLHDKNIIHRDIKLHNILMHKTEDGIRFKISDFGFSCYDLSNLSNLSNSLNSPNSQNQKNDSNLSKKYFKLSGTPYYMAPEIILNIKKMENITSYKKNKISDLYFYDKRIDIWSLGICIYELIFNLLPFSNIDNIKELEHFYGMSIIQEMMNKKINKKIFLNKNIKKLLLGMLRISIKDRYTIEDVIVDSNNELYIKEETYSEIKYIKDIIGIKENNYKLNEDMKQHVIKKPLSIMYSWEHINMDQCVDTLSSNDVFVKGTVNLVDTVNKNNLFVWIYNMFV